MERCCSVPILSRTSSRNGWVDDDATILLARSFSLAVFLIIVFVLLVVLLCLFFLLFVVLVVLFVFAIFFLTTAVVVFILIIIVLFILLLIVIFFILIVVVFIPSVAFVHVFPAMMTTDGTVTVAARVIVPVLVPAAVTVTAFIVAPVSVPVIVVTAKPPLAMAALVIAVVTAEPPVAMATLFTTEPALAMATLIIAPMTTKPAEVWVAAVATTMRVPGEVIEVIVGPATRWPAVIAARRLGKVIEVVGPVTRSTVIVTRCPRAAPPGAILVGKTWMRTISTDRATIATLRLTTRVAPVGLTRGGKTLVVIAGAVALRLATAIAPVGPIRRVRALIVIAGIIAVVATVVDNLITTMAVVARPIVVVIMSVPVAIILVA